MYKTECKLEFSAVSTGGKTTAIIVAAGCSARMNGVNKQFALIGGIPCIIRSISAFDSNKEIDNIVVVTRREDILKIQQLCEQYGISKVTDIVEGGSCRADSVKNGIAACGMDCDIVLIHDGARPLVSDKIITDVKNAAEMYGAAVCTVPVTDTVKITEDTGRVVSTPERKNLVCAQTPQGFEFCRYKEALLRHAADESITDDCMLIELENGTVYTVEGSRDNIKITTPFDLKLAELILNGRENNE